MGVVYVDTSYALTTITRWYGTCYVFIDVGSLLQVPIAEAELSAHVSALINSEISDVEAAPWWESLLCAWYGAMTVYPRIKFSVCGPFIVPSIHHSSRCLFAWAQRLWCSELSLLQRHAHGADSVLSRDLESTSAVYQRSHQCHILSLVVITWRK